MGCIVSTRRMDQESIHVVEPQIIEYANKNMNDENKKGLEILITQGPEEMVKYVFNPTGKRELSYAEMRARFG